MSDSDQSNSDLLLLIDKYITEGQLYLNKCMITDDILKYICSKDVQRVKMILIGWNWITNKGVIHFQKGNWKNLINLSLWDNDIGSKGCKYLSKSTFNQLQYLNLNNNNIDNRGLLHISKLKAPNLTKIQLQGNRLGCQSIVYLIHANWKNLKTLQLCNNFIENDEIYHVFMTKYAFETLRFGKNKICQSSKLRIKKALSQKFQKVNIDL